uniref:DNA polymerase kappa n=1 Tax=Salix viminalis TaxID=40686 RepID=A0A6N2N8D9_SALVM
MEKNENLSGDKPRPWHSYHTVYTNAKAGMEGVDKEKMQRIVYETSKGSKYFENEEKKEALLRQKIENMRAQRAKLSAADLSHYQTVADRRILELEATRDLSRIWLHADMDAFYAAVETLSNRLLVHVYDSTANYEARRFGVRAAMPGFIARKLCPELIFVPTDFKKYTHYSELTRKVFEKYDPNFMAASLDEAYLDITEVCKERSMSGGEVCCSFSIECCSTFYCVDIHFSVYIVTVKIAEELRKCVNEETGLTCSAGVAPNRLLAKIGGIGKVTEHILRDAFGISTCEEMLQKGGLLCALFFLSVGLGLEDRYSSVSSRKSISSERTFSATDDETLLYQKLADIAEMLCTDMKKGGLCGRTLTLKLKTASFEYASKLLKAELPISLRLMAYACLISMTDCSPSDPTQKTLNNFIVSADLSRKNLVDSKSLGSDINDLKLMNNMEGSFSIESHELQRYGIRDPLDSNNLQDLNVHHCTSTDSVEAEKIREPSSNKIADKVITKDMAGEVSQWKESGLSLPGQLEGEALTE